MTLLRQLRDLLAVGAVVAFLATVIAGAIGPAAAPKGNGPEWPRPIAGPPLPKPGY